jgi:hypothetical protein
MAFNPLKIFKKKNDEVIDLTKLRKNINMTTESTATETSESGLGFISNLASASTTESASKPKTISNIDPDKFERFGKRVDRMLGRMELLERKIERIEHRLDIG